MAVIDRLDFRAFPAANAGEVLTDQIGQLAFESLVADFPNRPLSDLAHFAHEASLNAGDPNRAVGTPAIRAGQAYSRAVNVLAFAHDTGKLIAHLPMADNASSRLPSVLGRAEIHAKLHFRQERFLKARWAWAGMCSLTDEAREMLNDTPLDEATIVDALLTTGVQERNRLQPMSAYPYFEETLWAYGLKRAGFRHLVTTGQQEVLAFGSETPVRQETWRYESVGKFMDRVIQRAGIERVLAQTKAA